MDEIKFYIQKYRIKIDFLFILVFVFVYKINVSDKFIALLFGMKKGYGLMYYTHVKE